MSGPEVMGGRNQMETRKMGMGALPGTWALTLTRPKRGWVLTREWALICGILR